MKFDRLQCDLLESRVQSMPDDNHADYEDEELTEEEALKELEDLQDELADINRDAVLNIRQRLIMWVIRWTIGFGLIWLLVWNWPQLSWLWWVGGIVAATSLVFYLGAYLWMSKQLDRAGERLENL